MTGKVMILEFTGFRVSASDLVLLPLREKGEGSSRLSLQGPELGLAVTSALFLWMLFWLCRPWLDLPR